MNSFIEQMIQFRSEELQWTDVSAEMVFAKQIDCNDNPMARYDAVRIFQLQQSSICARHVSVGDPQGQWEEAVM